MSDMHKQIRRACMLHHIDTLEGLLDKYDQSLTTGTQHRIKFNVILCSAIDTYSNEHKGIIPLILNRCGNLSMDTYVWLSISHVQTPADKLDIKQLYKHHQSQYGDEPDCVII